MDSNKLIISPQWSDCFPAGLRVLVVDGDPTHLKHLQNMLTKCNYEVTTCNLMREALDLFRETKDGFDIVISDVNLRDMDGFKLLEHVVLKMKIPVIMMSDDGETSKVMRGVQQGACDYLLKPIRMEEVRNIWQHVVRKQIRETKAIEGQESRMTITKQSDNEKKIIKDVDTKGRDRESGGDPLSVKKARVVWTVDLHQKFVKAVNQIGLDKAGPKKILDLMGVPWLTRENVASHLQKYRLYLRRLQKENELKATSSWMKLSDFSSIDHPAGNVCLQSSIAMQQNVLTNGVLSMPMPTTHTNASFGDVTYHPISSTSRISFNRFIGPLRPEEVKSKSKNEPYSQLEDQLITMPHIQEANIAPYIGYDDGIGKVSIVENSTGSDSMTHNNVYGNLESSLKNLIVGTSQGDIYPLNQDALVSIGSFGCSDIADVPRQIYGLANYDREYSGDPLECLVIDQGMYI